MSLFGLGAGFQTSFVVAALVAVMFLAQRLGGDDELLRRGLQVAIAFSAFLLVFSSTTAFIRAPDITASQLSGDDFSGQSQEEQEDYLNEAAGKASGAGSVHIGMGVLFAVAGAALYRRWTVIPIGLLFGGVLLLLLGAPPAPEAEDSLGAYYSIAFSTIGRADQEWDIARFAVLLLGTAVLVLYTYVRFEAPGGPPNGEPAPAEPPPPTDEASPVLMPS